MGSNAHWQRKYNGPSIAVAIFVLKIVLLDEQVLSSEIALSRFCYLAFCQQQSRARQVAGIGIDKGLA